MDRRRFIGGTAAAAATLAIRPGYAADNYPSHPITMINPFPPGGAADKVGQPLKAVLEPIVKQPVIIENKTGAAGAVGAQYAASAKPDGYTLLIHITSISGFAEVDKLFGRTPKFTRADFIPIARFVADPCVFLVNDKQPYKIAEGIRRRRQEETGPDRVLVVGSLRRAAHSDRPIHEGSRHQDAPSADARRRPGAHRLPRQQLAGADLVDLRLAGADQGRQGATARHARRQALQGAARRADHEGARLRRRVLPVGRPVRAERNAGRRSSTSCAMPPTKARIPTRSRRR